MAENTMESGRITTCTERVSTPGRTVDGTRASISMIESTAMESTLGRMVDNTWANGKMASNTERVCTDRQTEMRKRESGKTARELNGLMNDYNL